MEQNVSFLSVWFLFFFLLFFSFCCIFLLSFFCSVFFFQKKFSFIMPFSVPNFFLLAPLLSLVEVKTKKKCKSTKLLLCRKPDKSKVFYFIHFFLLHNRLMTQWPLQTLTIIKSIKKLYAALYTKANTHRHRHRHKHKQILSEMLMKMGEMEEDTVHFRSVVWLMLNIVQQKKKS